MAGWTRRSVMAAGGAIATSGLLASVETSRADEYSAVQSLAESSGWSSYRGNPGNTAYVPASGAFSAPDTLAWTYDEEGDIAADDGSVYLRTDDQVHALDDETGDRLWVADGFAAAGTPAVAGETVYVGGGQLTALEASSGDVRWEQAFDGEDVIPSPTVAFDTVYVVSGGTLYAFDADDGSLRWERSSVEAETTNGVQDVSFVSNPVAVANEMVYAEIGDAGFAALEATSGETEWTYWWDRSRTPHGNLAATADRLFTGRISDGGEFPVLDARTGEQTNYTTFRFPLAATDDVQVRTDRHSTGLVDYETDEDWSVGGATDQWGRAVIVGETVIVPSHPMADEPAIFGFDIADGSEQWSLRLTALEINTIDGMTWPSDSYVATEDTIYITGPSQLAAVRSTEGGDDVESENGEDALEDRGETAEDELGSASEEDADDGDGISELEAEIKAGTDASNDPGNETGGGSANESQNGSANETADDRTNESENGSMNETDDSANETEDDSTPGFTTGTGLVGGAVTLEWLRRLHAESESPTDSQDTDESAL